MEMTLKHIVGVHVGVAVVGNCKLVVGNYKLVVGCCR